MTETRTVQVCGITYTFEIPPTARDVLDWTVWILCIADPELHLEAALKWALKWIVDPNLTIDKLAIAMLDPETRDPASFKTNLAILCHTIAASAALPPEVLRDLSILRDKQVGIDPEWVPKGACGCPRCRRRVEVNPDGWDCLYDDLDPRGIKAAAATSSVGDGSEPYYLVQLRDTEERAKSRRWAKTREDREEKDDYLKRAQRSGMVKQ